MIVGVAFSLKNSPPSVPIGGDQGKGRSWTETLSHWVSLAFLCHSFRLGEEKEEDRSKSMQSTCKHTQFWSPVN